MIDPALLPLLRDPRRALPAYGYVATQDGRAGQNVTRYHPDLLTQRLQRDVLGYWASPPIDPHTGMARWLITLAGRQTGKSFTAEAAAYVKAGTATAWQHLCLADTPDRSRELLARVNLLHDMWDPDVRMERRYNNETWQATFADVRIGREHLTVRRMLTQHTGMDPVGAAWDSLHWSEVDFSGDDAERFWSSLQPALINRTHALVHLESTANPGTVTPSVGFLKEMYFAAKNRRAEGDSNRFLATFYPFWDGKLNRRPWHPTWTLDTDEQRLVEKYGPKGITLDHLAFRREVLATDPLIRRNPETFAIWYPFDDLTCWPVLQSSTFKAHHLARQLSERLVPWAPVNNHQWYPGRRKPAGEVDPDASYVMAIDPNGFGGRDHGAAEIREVWADEQREVCSFAGGRREGVDPQTLAAWVIPTCRRFKEAGALIKVLVESNGVGAATIALLKGVPGVSLYYTEPDKPGVASSSKSKQEALVNHQDALLDDLLLQDEDKFTQHQNYRNDKAVEETDAALQLQDSAPSRRRRPRHHWDKVSASMWASWAVAHGVVRRPFLPVVAPPRTSRSPCTEAEWEAWGARTERREYGEGVPVDYEVLP